MSSRWQVLGLASPRSAWARRVTEWSVSGALSFDFVKCVSAQDVLQRITADGAGSLCLLADIDLLARQSELIAALRAGAATLIGVGAAVSKELGVNPLALLEPDFAFHHLEAALSSHSQAHPRVGATPGSGAVRDLSEVATASPATASPASGPHAAGATHQPDQPAQTGQLISLVGRAGSGVSTTSIALAQGLTDQFGPGAVLLADLSRFGDQALLHDSPDIVPGIQELCEDPAAGARSFTFGVDERGYDLLLGLRRRRDWINLRRDSFRAALESMRASYRFVVADLDDDLEGASETGSEDIETRNFATRHAALVANAVIVIGTAALGSTRSMFQIIDDLSAMGIERARIRPLLCRLTGRRNLRSTGRLLATNARSPSAIAELRHVDELHRNGTRLPSQLVAPVLECVSDLVAQSNAPARNQPRNPTRNQPTPSSPLAQIG